MLAIRRAHPAFGVGRYTDLGGANPSVLAFLREHGGETLLCVHNLSRHPQPVQLNLSRRFHSHIPVELTGGAQFPHIGLRPYLLTLPGYGSYWFAITPARQRPVPSARRAPSEGVPAELQLISG